MKLKTITSTQQFLIDLLQAEAMNREFEIQKNVMAVDWEELYSLLNRHGILPVVYRLLSLYIPSSQRSSFENVVDAHIKKVGGIIEELKKVAQLAEMHTVQLVFMKGVVLSKLIYDDLYSRVTRDIDTLLNESDVPAFSQVLKEDGYIHAIVNANDFEELPFPILKQYDHHEFFEYYKKKEDGTIVEVELQRYVHGSVKEQHIGEFLHHDQIIDVDGIEIKTFDLEHTFIVLCENIYENSEWSHSGPKLKDYFDLLTFLEKYKHGINWANIRRLITKYELLDILNIVMYDLNELFRDCIGSDILAWFDYEPPAMIAADARMVLNWNSNITQRVFDSSENQWDRIAQMLIEKSFSDENPYYLRPILPKSKAEIDINRFDEDFEFTDLKYAYPIKYKLCTDNNQLSLLILIGRELHDRFDRFELDISVFQANLSSETYSVAKDGNRLVVTSLTSGQAYEVDVRTQGDNFVLDVLLVKCVPRHMTINVALSEKIYKSIKHTLHYSGRPFWINRAYVQ